MDYYPFSSVVQDFIKSRGLVPYYEDVELDFPNKEDMRKAGLSIPTKRKLTMFTLPEVIVTARKK